MPLNPTSLYSPISSFLRVWPLVTRRFWGTRGILRLAHGLSQVNNKIELWALITALESVNNAYFHDPLLASSGYCLCVHHHAALHRVVLPTTLLSRLRVHGRQSSQAGASNCAASEAPAGQVQARNCRAWTRLTDCSYENNMATRK